MDYSLLEKYPVYKEIFNQLKSGELTEIYDYKKIKDYSRFYFEIYKDTDEITSFKLISNISKLNWKNGDYNKQHWGNWLHSVSPYVGRMTPSLAHWLIKSATKKKDVVLDPFCGIGTVCLEADLMGRGAIGIDLNPYAHLIAKAKFDRRPIEYYLNFLKNLRIDTSKIDLINISPFVRQYFHDETLKEIICIRDIFIKEQNYFLLACLMGILHGNRPGYLSVWTGCIIPMPPRKKGDLNFDENKDIPEYRPVIPRLAAKVKRMYINGFDINTKSTIILGDSRDPLLKDNSVDVIISSPPYYNTLDYVSSNRLRLAILGYDFDERESLKKELIQQKNSYLDEMKKVGLQLHKVLKPDKYVIFVLGDVHTTVNTINTAEDIAQLYSRIGFKKIDIIDDILPRNKCAHQNGNHKLKYDRILILQVIK